jgi:hypothetical protein
MKAAFHTPNHANQKLNFSVDGQKYPALLDTGSWVNTFTSATAEMLDITKFPHGPVVHDYGPTQSYMVPTELDGGLMYQYPQRFSMNVQTFLNDLCMDLNRLFTGLAAKV